MGIQKAEEVYLMLKTGVINGLSIGYIPLEYDIDHESGARVLKQVELWEVSLVTFPANLAAQVVNVKSQDNEQKMLIRAIKKGKKCAHRRIYFYLKLIASKGFTINTYLTFKTFRLGLTFALMFI